MFGVWASLSDIMLIYVFPKIFYLEARNYANFCSMKKKLISVIHGFGYEPVYPLTQFFYLILLALIVKMNSLHVY